MIALVNDSMFNWSATHLASILRVNRTVEQAMRGLVHRWA